MTHGSYYPKKRFDILQSILIYRPIGLAIYMILSLAALIQYQIYMIPFMSKYIEKGGASIYIIRMYTTLNGVSIYEKFTPQIIRVLYNCFMHAFNIGLVPLGFFIFRRELKNFRKAGHIAKAYFVTIYIHNEVFVFPLLNSCAYYIFNLTPDNGMEYAENTKSKIKSNTMDIFANFNRFSHILYLFIYDLQVLYDRYKSSKYVSFDREKQL